MANSKDWISDEELARLTESNNIPHNTHVSGGNNLLSREGEHYRDMSEQNLSGREDYLTSSTTIRTTKYPWGKWLDGNLHIATAGVDFNIPVSTFQIMVANTARRKGLFATTSVQANRNVAIKVFKTKAERDVAKTGDYDDGYGNVDIETEINGTA